MRFTRVTISPTSRVGLLTLDCAGLVAYGRPWMLPCGPAGTLRNLVAGCAQVGRESNLGQRPRWIAKSTAIVVLLMREIDEMLISGKGPS
jgi:hypothetical protein